jgi:hypothetical protein
MVNLIDLVEVIDDTLSKETCELLIDTFEAYSSGVPFNLTDNRNITTEISNIHQELIKLVVDVRDLYYEKCYLEIFPDTHAFEKFLITKHDLEVETRPNSKVGVKSYEEARRFLCFKWFLNSNNGGHINFLDLSVQPERGKLLVYPPLWMFPYKEEPPAEVSKYTLTTYLHYK